MYSNRVNFKHICTAGIFPCMCSPTYHHQNPQQCQVLLCRGTRACSDGHALELKHAIQALHAHLCCCGRQGRGVTAIGWLCIGASRPRQVGVFIQLPCIMIQMMYRWCINMHTPVAVVGSRSVVAYAALKYLLQVQGCTTGAMQAACTHTQHMQLQPQVGERTHSRLQRWAL